MADSPNFTAHDVAHLSGCDPHTALVNKSGSKYWLTVPEGTKAGTVLPDGAVVVVTYAELVDRTADEEWNGEGWARELCTDAAARIAGQLNADGSTTT